MTSLTETLARIAPLDAQAMEAARQRQNCLTKPTGSLGRLEEISIQVAGITGKERPRLPRKTVITAAGDHGVVAAGVSAYPQEVTPQMVLNILYGGAGISVLSRHVGARVIVIDAGVIGELPSHPNLRASKVAHGTANMAEGPAMTRAQAIQSIEAGIAAVEAEMANGLDLVCTGDMGIGNSSPSTAIAAVFTGKPVAAIAGRGTGVDDAGLNRKIAVIEQSLKVNQPNPADTLDILAKVGGFEIGAIAGVILGAAAHRIPAVVDGFISTAGALIAVGLCPLAKGYILSAHRSFDSGQGIMLDYLGLSPVLDLNMRLGEGTGAILAADIIDGACKILDEMATFAEAGVSDKE